MMNAANKTRYRAITCGHCGERGLKRPGLGGAEFEKSDGTCGIVK